jgi:site-specific recombinase XerD
MLSTLLPVRVCTPDAGLADSDNLKAAARAAQEFARLATAPNTRKAYRSDWADFAAWCAAQHLDPLPARPESVGLYLASMADTHKMSTITRRLAAITKQHRNRGYDSPASMKHSAVHDVIAGMRRKRGTRPEPKRALSTDELRQMATATPATPHGLRDHALLLIGFAGGFRRSELAAIDC